MKYVKIILIILLLGAALGLVIVPLIFPSFNLSELTKPKTKVQTAQSSSNSGQSGQELVVKKLLMLAPPAPDLSIIDKILAYSDKMVGSVSGLVGLIVLMKELKGAKAKRASKPKPVKKPEENRY